MAKYRKTSTYRVLFLLRKGNANIHKDGMATISIRITIDGNALEFSSKIKVDPKKWDAKAGKMQGRGKEALEVNNALDFIKTRLNNKYREILETDDLVTPDKLRDKFLGIEDKKYSLLVLFDQKIKQKQALVGKEILQGAVDKYKCTKSKIVGFIKEEYNKTDVLAREVQYDFITGFDLYLRTKHNCGHNMVVKHMRYLKQVITDALKRKIIQQDPFYDFTFSAKRGNREYLTEQEIKAVIECKPASKKLEEARDVFLFCCFTGLAYVDVSRLRQEDIIEKGNDLFIIKNREKTGVQSYIPLLDVAKEILEKYEQANFPNKKILPVHACQNMNNYIKQIAAICGINKNLSTHSGRHTFGTIMLTKGMSVESVCRMMGHTDIKTTQIYARILNSKVDDEINLVKNKFGQFQLNL